MCTALTATVLPFALVWGPQDDAVARVHITVPQFQSKVIVAPQPVGLRTAQAEELLRVYWESGCHVCV